MPGLEGQGGTGGVQYGRLHCPVRLQAIVNTVATSRTSPGRAGWIAFFLLALAWAWLLLLLAVPLTPGLPWSPAEKLAWQGSDFNLLIGNGGESDGALRVEGMRPSEGAVQALFIRDVDTARFPILSYRFDDLPGTLELSFFFRRAGAGEDLQVVNVPAPGRGTATIDLRRLDGWQGRVVEIGFAQFPDVVSIPAAQAFRPYSLRYAELSGASLRGQLAARWQGWISGGNWTYRSLNAQGPDIQFRQGPALPLLLAALATGILLLGVTLLRWRGRQLVRAVVLAALAAWLVLDLRWLAILDERHASTSLAYRDRPLAQRMQLLPDQELLAAASDVQRALAAVQPPAKLVVMAGGPHERGRLMYHLRPLDAGPLDLVGYGTPEVQEGLFVLLYGVAEPAFDAGSGQLFLPAGPVPARVVLERNKLRLYRLGSAP